MASSVKSVWHDQQVAKQIQIHMHIICYNCKSTHPHTKYTNIHPPTHTPTYTVHCHSIKLQKGMEQYESLLLTLFCFKLFCSTTHMKAFPDNTVWSISVFFNYPHLTSNLKFPYTVSTWSYCIQQCLVYFGNDQEKKSHRYSTVQNAHIIHTHPLNTSQCLNVLPRTRLSSYSVICDLHWSF